MAFNKKQPDDRERWLSHYEPTKMLIPVASKASYTNFVNCELIHFSNADDIRSLPHVMNGLYDAEEKKSKAAKAEAKKAETGSTTSAKGEVEPCSLKGFLLVQRCGCAIRTLLHGRGV